jgi:hypothetical protein
MEAEQRVARCSDTSAVGRVIKRDGRRVRVDFSESGGRASTWLTVEELSVLCPGVLPAPSDDCGGQAPVPEGLPPVPSTAPPPVPSAEPPPVPSTSPPTQLNLQPGPKPEPEPEPAATAPAAGRRAGGGNVLARWQQATAAESEREAEAAQARRAAFASEMEQLRAPRAKVDSLRQTLDLARTRVRRAASVAPTDATDATAQPAPAAGGQVATAAPAPAAAPRTSDSASPSAAAARAAAVEAEVARRRAGLFQDVEDEEELEAKALLVEKVDQVRGTPHQLGGVSSQWG